MDPVNEILYGPQELDQSFMKWLPQILAPKTSGAKWRSESVVFIHVFQASWQRQLQLFFGEIIDTD